MKFQVKEISPIKKELEVTIPAERVQREMDQAFAEIQRGVTLKGFRPGKVPRSIIEQQYQNEAKSRTLEALVAKTHREVIEEAALQPVSMPEVAVKDFGTSEDFVYQMTVEVRPSIEVKGYTSLSLTKEKAVATDREVEENLKALQERMAQMVPIGETGAKEKRLLPLDDEFAKDLGNFQTLEEVKGKIREDILQAKEEAAKTDLKKQVIERLIEKNDFQVPEGMVRWELEEAFHRLATNLKAQGLTLEQVGIKREDFFSKNRAAALFHVKALILFDAIAQKEQIPVTDKEVDQRIAEMARASGQSEEFWKKSLRENNRSPWIESLIREEKTLDFVLSQSKIVVNE